jgi:hypothetical protein
MNYAIVLAIVLTLLSSGCSPDRLNGIATRPPEKAPVRLDRTEQVDLTACVEDIVFHARPLPISPGDEIPAIVQVAILRIESASIAGPSRIAIAFDSAPGLLGTKGQIVSFRMKFSFYKAAEYSRAGILDGHLVYVGALEDLRRAN